MTSWGIGLGLVGLFAVGLVVWDRRTGVPSTVLKILTGRPPTEAETREAMREGIAVACQRWFASVGNTCPACRRPEFVQSRDLFMDGRGISKTFVVTGECSCGFHVRLPGRDAPGPMMARVGSASRLGAQGGRVMAVDVGTPLEWRFEAEEAQLGSLLLDPSGWTLSPAPLATPAQVALLDAASAVVDGATSVSTHGRAANEALALFLREVGEATAPCGVRVVGVANPVGL
jgi:hypothetical protein